MKIFLLSPKEDWICDRLVSEWYENFKDISTSNIHESDIIWLLAGWCWNHIPYSILKNKKVVVTEHHIVPEKFNRQKYNNFIVRDQFVDCYHVPNNKTKKFIQKLTKKEIKVISYWYNNKLWKPINKNESLEKLGLDKEKYYIGSFQRDTEGSDLITPKLEKGPDIFCDYIIKNQNKFKGLHVLLGGWRRQYVEKRLEEANIPHTLYEKSSVDKIKLLYSVLDLYIVSSRYEGGPQAIIEASGMKVPIISTDVGIASNILSKNCIIDMKNQFYIPQKTDINHAWQKVNEINIQNQGKKFIKLFEETLR